MRIPLLPSIALAASAVLAPVVALGDAPAAAVRERLAAGFERPPTRAELETHTEDLDALLIELYRDTSNLMVVRMRALDLLAPRLETSRSVPLDRASARALITLGDAAARLGDYDLAMGSYARALDLLSLLLEEAAP